MASILYIRGIAFGTLLTLVQDHQMLSSVLRVLLVLCVCLCVRFQARQPAASPAAAVVAHCLRVGIVSERSSLQLLQLFVSASATPSGS